MSIAYCCYAYMVKVHVTIDLNTLNRKFEFGSHLLLNGGLCCFAHSAGRDLYTSTKKQWSFIF